MASHLHLGRSSQERFDSATDTLRPVEILGNVSNVLFIIVNAARAVAKEGRRPSYLWEPRRLSVRNMCLLYFGNGPPYFVCVLIPSYPILSAMRLHPWGPFPVSPLLTVSSLSLEFLCTGHGPDWQATDVL